MGFFSYNCKACGLSVLNSTSIIGDLSVVSEVVALDYKSNVHEGYYDGYGSVGINDLLEDGRNGVTTWDDMFSNKQPAVWHKFCYDGTTVYPGASEGCEFQGHFIDEFKFKGMMASNEIFMTNYVRSLP